MEPIRKVAVLGANGNLGSVILTTLVDSGFDVTVLKRASSQSVPAVNARLAEVSDDMTVDELKQTLSGQDAFVIAIPLRGVDLHLRLVEGAAAAGVRRIIPADYGSVDARSPRARELVALYEKKTKVRERLEELSAASGGHLSWTSIVCGHFFDWGLRNGFLHIHPDSRKAEILGDGNAKSSLSTLARVSEAVVRIFQKQDETKNRVLMVQSFSVSQNEVVRALEVATDSEWAKEYQDMEAFIDKNKKLADAGDKDAVEDLVFALGVLDGNWETKDDFAMELLGLQNEDLDATIKQVLAN